MAPARSVPNYEARRLSSGGCSRIALFYSDQQIPFLAQVLLAAINASTAYGTQLLVRSSNSPTKRSTEKLVLNAARSGVQGLVERASTSAILARRGRACAQHRRESTTK
jgi:DNA-binding LacI/PurR family transcriptional regulator